MILANQWSYSADCKLDPFKEFCEDIFSSLSRNDQRRAGETYLYGLLNCEGRKSIRRLAAAAPGRSEQSLQQFINQSPWDHEPIRQRLFAQLVNAVQPTAWAIEEVAFPKHGHYSAAVARQYVRSLGRVANCQLAITVTLLSDDLVVPVNWRLIVPDSWGRDKDRRARVRMPDHELPRPYWQYQLEVLDDMALEWGVPSAPILVDAAHRGGVEAFLGALELRRQPYVAHVSPSLVVGYQAPTPRVVPTKSAAGTGGSWRGTINELIGRIKNVARETVEWRSRGDRTVQRSQFVQLPVRSQPGDAATPPSSQQYLLTEWPIGHECPRGFWITNIVDRPLTELVRLAKSHQLVSPSIERLAGQFGLRDHEGRTFAGWHHHVTLATAAYTFHVLDKLRAGAEIAQGLLSV
jgi:SRSO17 transposase